MRADPGGQLVLPLGDPAADLRRVGGKGASLARLASAGLPVPAGFHVTTEAYRRFVRLDGLRDEILAAVSTADPDRPATLEAAAARIGPAFARRAIPDEIAGAVRHNYARLGGGDLAVAVRSSATAEDLPELSFAGQQDTYLNIRGAAALLDAAQAAALTRLGTAVERLYGRPMDIEWARRDGRFLLVQARPVTGLRDTGRPAEEWNDSLAGDYLWTRGNLGEAIPDVMTPCTWSLVRLFMSDAMATGSLPGYLAYGNIGGRFYLNLSVTATLASTFGIDRKSFTTLTEETFGRLPEGVEIPPVRLSRRQVLRKATPVAVGVIRRVVTNTRRLPEVLAAAPERCEAARARIRATTSPAALAELWRAEVAPLFHECCRMLEAAGRQGGGALVRLRIQLRRLLGEADANAVLTGLHTDANQLASLGPLLGLAQLARGEIDRETFARRYGHRGAHEFEVSVPRPAEDPAWLDRQLAGVREASQDVTALLARQEAARAAAWRRFSARYPRKVRAVRRKLERWARAARARELARSEVIRTFWVLRAFVLRAGELTGHGTGLFFLTIDEILAVLGGDDTPTASIPARRATYQAYAALPPYPTLIRGRFDPFRWAADPRRRSDLYDERGAAAPAADAITGFPGAAGVVEGVARVLATPEDGDALHPGEVLVTSVTNIGWTPLFPRAAAVVTDVGAPLSHAAILARELGIPAVVGCGNATMRLHDGDRVRVDGEHGTVEVLEQAARA